MSQFALKFSIVIRRTISVYFEMCLWIASLYLIRAIERLPIIWLHRNIIKNNLSGFWCIYTISFSSKEVLNDHEENLKKKEKFCQKGNIICASRATMGTAGTHCDRFHNKCVQSLCEYKSAAARLLRLVCWLLSWHTHECFTGKTTWWDCPSSQDWVQGCNHQSGLT